MINYNGKWRIDLDEHICSRINQLISTDCRTFWLRRPLSTSYKTVYVMFYKYNYNGNNYDSMESLRAGNVA